MEKLSVAQNWFVLGWLSVLTFMGAAGLMAGEPYNDFAGWVFGIPLALLFVWGFAKFAENNF